MNIEITDRFAKDVEFITLEKVRTTLAAIIAEVEQANSISDIGNVKKMKGFKAYFRIKMGNYRVGIMIEGDTVKFVRFMHRKDIYSKFP